MSNTMRENNELKFDSQKEHNTLLLYKTDHTPFKLFIDGKDAKVGDIFYYMGAEYTILEVNDASIKVSRKLDKPCDIPCGGR